MKGLSFSIGVSHIGSFLKKTLPTTIMEPTSWIYAIET